jgi:hypothetical protein
MFIYKVVNVENVKFHELSMLYEDEEGPFLPSIEELALDAQIRLPKDIFL